MSKTKSKSERNSQEMVADSVSLGAPTKPRLTPTYTSANFNLVVSLLLSGTFIHFFKINIKESWKINLSFFLKTR